MENEVVSRRNSPGESIEWEAKEVGESGKRPGLSIDPGNGSVRKRSRYWFWRLTDTLGEDGASERNQAAIERVGENLWKERVVVDYGALKLQSRWAVSSHHKRQFVTPWVAYNIYLLLE